MMRATGNGRTLDGRSCKWRPPALGKVVANVIATTTAMSLATTVMIVMAGVVMSGCNVLAPASYLIGGMPKVEAEYLMVDRATVVFVDDRASVIRSNSRAVRLAIAERVTEDLMVNEVVLPENMISSRDALSFVLAQDRHGKLLSMDAIGREVGAEQVIFIEMALFAESPDGVTPRPTAVADVRVIDVSERVRLYPASDGQRQGPPSRRISAQLAPVDPAVFRSTASRLKVFEGLSDRLGRSIAKLFYEHESVDIGDRLNPN